ncbi:hypothetical protein C2G38_2195656 [Gigaspora rosea]|uniref:F-box domain-containing protein n=1 Tax=Gigaspora rosea TaxID=44941 RepID=A0A397UYJ1_9GLOM|nr:hypothetical protein C2G38_2195656 [Gigaspora rosea]
MASKIFAGDMPELLENILKNLNNDTYSLYSCALVSRHWCRISIPIIWQDPFKYVEQNTSFISKYCSSLDEDEKLILKDYGINEEFSKTLFDYRKLPSLQNRIKNTSEALFSAVFLESFHHKLK